MSAAPQTNGIHIVTTKSQIRDFVMFPYSHYSDEPFWVAPLVMDEKKLIDTKKNPFYADAELAMFIAEKNGKIAGRIGQRGRGKNGSQTGRSASGASKGIGRGY